MGVAAGDLIEIANRLREACDEHDRVCDDLGKAEADHKRAYLTAHANSTALFPDRRVKEHEVAAEQGSFEQWTTLNALQYERRALTERMHSLRQILSAYQTQQRTERELVA